VKRRDGKREKREEENREKGEEIGEREAACTQQEGRRGNVWGVTSPGLTY
jgi:hypothetical protein